MCGEGGRSPVARNVVEGADWILDGLGRPRLPCGAIQRKSRLWAGDVREGQIDIPADPRVLRAPADKSAGGEWRRIRRGAGAMTRVRAAPAAGVVLLDGVSKSVFGEREEDALGTRLGSFVERERRARRREEGGGTTRGAVTKPDTHFEKELPRGPRRLRCDSAGRNWAERSNERNTSESIAVALQFQRVKEGLKAGKGG
ncbi:hypothetical protein B0H17DRAFT_507650 [Mycena rosella]|uniref:Uncharacterized protein n=1 Tax=Mycena rosella TaxID=1033263 RepID=A0AAD7BY73_MYCRO|nr:hypothetical protein B0H17DRAFT_507650 [Mycena rosella]